MALPTSGALSAALLLMLPRLTSADKSHLPGVQRACKSHSVMRADASAWPCVAPPLNTPPPICKPGTPRQLSAPNSARSRALASAISWWMLPNGDSAPPVLVASHLFRSKPVDTPACSVSPLSNWPTT